VDVRGGPSVTELVLHIHHQVKNLCTDSRKYLQSDLIHFAFKDVTALRMSAARKIKWNFNCMIWRDCSQQVSP
jgi:hypothetical protein